MTPSPRLSIIALVLPFAVACHSYRPVTAAAPEGIVRVTFTPPRDVWSRRDTMPQEVLHDITRVDGRVAAVSGDTLFVNADEIRDSAGRRVRTADESQQLVIVVDASTRIEQRHFSTGKTLAGAAGVMLLATTVALIALIDLLVHAAR